MDATAIFLNSYRLEARWRRAEGREMSASRISSFLGAAAAVYPPLGTWLLEGFGTSGAFRKADISPPGIAGLLVTRHDEAGFSMTLSNGLNASFHATVGGVGRENFIVLAFLPREEPGESKTWRELMAAAIATLDPDSAVVSSRQRTSARHAASLGAWFTYRRGEEIADLCSN